MKKFFKLLSCISAVASIAILSMVSLNHISLPDRFSVVGDDVLVLSNYENLSVNKIQDVGNDGEVSTGVSANYNAEISLFGVFPVKTVNVDIVEPGHLIACGTPFGIKMFTDGVVVIGLGTVDSEIGNISPGKEAGINIGDVITAIDGQTVMSNDDVGNIISASEGHDVTVSIRRKNMDFDVNLTPLRSQTDNQYKAGLWVRDSSAGIGTLTFYDPSTGVFGGLGHPITDVDTGEILPLMSGEVVDVEITGVIKGQSGTAGELKGNFLNNITRGNLFINNETGVFGTMLGTPGNNEPMPYALKQDIKIGPATIFTTVDGTEPKEYDIEIEKISLLDTNLTKNMIIKITDPELIQLTGGIVQGMSGSPIIQNGKIVGAVTHVFVNDPTGGYGIFIENMLESAQSITE